MRNTKCTMDELKHVIGRKIPILDFDQDGPRTEADPGGSRRDIHESENNSRRYFNENHTADDVQWCKTIGTVIEYFDTRNRPSCGSWTRRRRAPRRHIWRTTTKGPWRGTRPTRNVYERNRKCRPTQPAREKMVRPNWTRYVKKKPWVSFLRTFTRHSFPPPSRTYWFRKKRRVKRTTARTVRHRWHFTPKTWKRFPYNVH